MPWNRRLYPANWNEIALVVKNAANWTCQECGRPCRRPGQRWLDFVVSLCTEENHRWYLQTEDEVFSDETGEWGSVEKPQRFCLTVAHLNHTPSDCRPENLRALCAPCHCRYDLKAMVTKKRMKAEREGQLVLFLGEKDEKA